MKKKLHLSKIITTLFLMFILQLQIKSQSLGLSVSNSTACAFTGTNPVACSITSTVSGALTYSYSVIQTCSSGTFLTSAGNFTTLNSTIYLSCTGPYTVFCNAIGSGSTIVGTASASGAFNSAASASISISPNNGAGCLGTTFTINLSGASSFTTIGNFGTSNGTSIFVNPSGSNCFSVTASNGTCSSTSTRCFTLYAPPSVNLSPTLSLCNTGNATVIPSGATSYTWNTGATTPFLVISPSVAACYTVTGSNPYCSGTSSAVTCVTWVPAPTLTYSSSANALCVGSSVSLTASGATNYTWAISSSSLGTSYFTSNNVVYTPTIAGNYYAQITGNAGACNVNGSVSFTVGSPASVIVPSTYTMCIGNNVNLIANGSSSYTWSTGSNSNFINVSPTVSTCYTVTGSNNVCPGTASAVTCVNVVSAPPAIIVNGPNTICYGSTNSYTASGGLGTYNWINATTYASYGTGSVLSVPNQTNCFFVVQTGSTSGCAALGATVCPNILNSPTISIASASNGTVCSGSTDTLIPSGAITYTWNNGSNSINFTYTPTSSNCFTVFGTNANGCTSSAVRCVSVLPLPVVGIIGINSACPGSTIIYSANGAISYNWSNSSSSNTISISTSTPGCYSVTGYNGFGCSATAIKCFTPLSIPAVNVLGNTSVCIGSSTTYTATGGNTYTWNTGSNSNTLYILPTASSNYTVTASHALNNCTNSAVVALNVNTNCAIVWPGDANRDGQVDNTDVFELGLAANSTGAGRSGASNSWTGQYASAWSGTVSTGWNKAHADCNGDGTINANDTVAIGSNYSLTHAFKNTNSTNGIDLYLVPQNSEAYGGLWNVVDIILGDAGNNITQLYGAAFDLDFDQNMLENDSISLNYTPSFLNAGAQNIEFRKTFFTAGKTYAANVRTNNNNVIGFGKIGELRFKLRNDLADNSSFNFGISNGKKTDAVGNMGTLSTSGFMNLTVNNNATGLSAKTKSINQVQFYPNPANGYLILNSTSRIKTTYRLFDLTGRCVLSGEMTGLKTIDISALDAGVYVFDFETNQIHTQQKLIKH